MADEPELTYDGTLREMSTDAGVLRYHEAGEGPALLLLHGSGPGVTGWRNFRGTLGTFAAHFRCLVLEFPGGPYYWLFAASETKFFLRTAETEIEFQKAAGGVVTEITIHNSDGSIFAQGPRIDVESRP